MIKNPGFPLAGLTKVTIGLARVKEHVQPKIYKSHFLAEGGTSKPDVTGVPDEDPEDFPDSGPQNPAEAQSYHDKIDHIMDMFSKMLENDRKDAL